MRDTFFGRGWQEVAAVTTDDMALPEGMTAEQALAIHRAVERRYVAEEVAKRLSHPRGAKWAERAAEALEAGKASPEELFEATWAVYWDEGFGRFVEPTMREGFSDVI